MSDKICLQTDFRKTERPGRKIPPGIRYPLPSRGGGRLANLADSPHRLRHSFASELLRNGTNPRAVQELMRHSSIDTLFDHYAHVLRSDLKDAVEGIG